MELLKFIAGEFLHIEPKAYLFCTWSWVFTSDALHQRWRDLGWLQRWPAGGLVSLPAHPWSSCRSTSSYGKDFSAKMETLFHWKAKSGTCISKQDVDRGIASIASAIVLSWRRNRSHAGVTFQSWSDESMGRGL
jgi:hypothetical protein